MIRSRFDPYDVLRELERERVTYVIVGGLARVIHGSGELTRGIDLTPSPRPKNLDRLQTALESLNARRVDRMPLDLAALDPEHDPVIALRTDAGEVKVVLEPAGTNGYDDLRHRANHEPIGEGLRPSVAGPGDLVRMLEALGRDNDRLTIETMQRILELDRGLSWDRWAGPGRVSILWGRERQASPDDRIRRARRGRLDRRADRRGAGRDEPGSNPRRGARERHRRAASDAVSR
jgi:hypothetical protein